ncbi:hypothetical protein DFH06DRAFT_1324518 [Mycena polygramma]|nr:hypothetical protein DFH06DRAFT_1324518 [Mycena polygramma]
MPPQSLIFGPGVALTFEVPINSNVVGATPVTRTKKYRRGVPFAVAYAEMAQTMGLDPSVASLGYKWDNERANVPIHGLSNAVDWEQLLEQGIGQTQRARSRRVACHIKNLKLPEETAPAAQLATAGKKRKSASTSNGSPGKKTHEYTKDYRELKARLQCAAHKDFCYVVAVDGHHHRVEPDLITLWAKEISLGHASLKKPPENIVFQEFFLRERKRPHRSAGPTTPDKLCAPTIHVTVNTGTSSNGGVTTSTSPPRRTPLAPITSASQNAANIDVPTSVYRSEASPRLFDENDSPEAIYYPLITDILEIIDKSPIFVDSDVLPFPAIVFAEELHAFQITRVDHVPILDTDFYVDQIGMPVALAELFVAESLNAMGRAQKGKGKLGD